MVNFSISYKGNLRCEIKHEPSGAVVLTDAPLDNHGKGESFSPTDLVASALGACIATILGILAEREKIDLTGMTMSASKEMSTDKPRRISKINITINFPLPSSHPKRSMLEKAAASCPVFHSLHPMIDKRIVFKWQ